MPTIPEFEEKSFEKAFFAELARRTNVFFPPGQVLEHLVGCDDALFLPVGVFYHPFYVRRSRGQRFLPGVKLDHTLLPSLFGKPMPRFKFNFFVQYKRPSYVWSKGAKHWADWRKPYFQYKINTAQQTQLETLLAASAGRALVVYSSPAFTGMEELCDYIEAAEVVRNSNIVSIGRLTGHQRFTYDARGSKGKAHSDPEEIEEKSFDNLLEAYQSLDAIDASTLIQETAKAVREAASTSTATMNFITRTVERLMPQSVPDNNVARHIREISAFCDINHIRWYMIG